MAFDATSGLVLVDAALDGPLQTARLVLVLDTGATGSIISHARLLAAGYDPSAASERAQITTGSGVEFVPRLSVSRLTSLDRERLDLPVLAHTLPPNVRVDGLLGLDFFRGRDLRIDFRAGVIELSE